MQQCLIDFQMLNICLDKQQHYKDYWNKILQKKIAWKAEVDYIYMSNFLE